MYNRRRGAEIADRARARRMHEDSARRLKDEVPTLVSLAIAVKSVRGDAAVADSDHVRRVVVENAPALFEIPCVDRSCEDGGHDVTDAMLRGLRGGQATVEGESACHGHTGSVNCNRVLHYVATAVFSS